MDEPQVATGMENAAKVEILMKEYATLRAEVLQRVRARFELLGLLGVAAGLLLNVDARWELRIGNAAALAVLAAGAFVYLRIGIRRCAVFLVEIELRVNVLVGEDATGKLLTWETTQEEENWRWMNR